jgi:hypothetical protein
MCDLSFSLSLLVKNFPCHFLLGILSAAKVLLTLYVLRVANPCPPHGQSLAGRWSVARRVNFDFFFFTMNSQWIE